jgi:hypothetical protein
MAEERGASIYSAYIKEQLAAQETRKASIEQRGSAVITSSGALVSLLFGLVTLTTRSTTYELPEGAKSWIFAAMASFVIAAIAAIITNTPLFYSGVKTSDLQQALRGSIWNDPPPIAEKRIAATDIKVLRTAKSRNTFKGFALLGAVVAEVLAVLFLALAIRVVLVHA